MTILAPPETVGLRLSRCRERLGFTQEAVGQRIGVARNRYAKWEYGQGLPNVPHALRLAKLYNATVETLFGE